MLLPRGNGNQKQPSFLTKEFFPPKSSEGHQRNQITLGGFSRGSQEGLAVTLPAPGGTHLSLPFAGGAGDPQDQLAPLEGREGLGRNLLLSGRFISVSPSRAPFQGRAHTPCLSLTRSGGQDKEARRLHIPPCPGTSHTADLSLCKRIPTLPSLLFPLSLALPPCKDYQQNNRRKSRDIY